MEGETALSQRPVVRRQNQHKSMQQRGRLEDSSQRRTGNGRNSYVQVTLSHDEGQGETRGPAPGKMIETTGQRGRLSTKLGNSKSQPRDTDDFGIVQLMKTI